MSAVAHGTAPTGRADGAAAASDTVASAVANTAQSAHSTHSAATAATAARHSRGTYVQSGVLMQAVFGGFTQHSVLVLA
jgi:hypothetical protein